MSTVCLTQFGHKVDRVIFGKNAPHFILYKLGQEKKSCLFVKIRPTMILEIWKKVVFFFFFFLFLLYKRIPTLILEKLAKLVIFALKIVLTI